MVKEKLITQKTAVLRVIRPTTWTSCCYPIVRSQGQADDVVAKGLPASPGAAVGKIAFTADEAEERGQNGEQVHPGPQRDRAPKTSDGMHVAEGILTSTGGMTSHAAVVARGMGKPCVAGAGAIQIDEKAARPSTSTADVFTAKDTTQHRRLHRRGHAPGEVRTHRAQALAATSPRS